MPAEEVLHSLHAQALEDEQIRNNPAMQRFTDQAKENLHAMVAAAGTIRRMMSGERLEALLPLLQEQLGVFVRTHMDARTAFTQLMADTKGNETLQAMSQLLGLVEQQFGTMRPILSLLVPEEVFTGAH